MPVKSLPRQHSRAPKHKHTQPYLQAYWPYLPMMLIVIIGLVFGGPRHVSTGKNGVLAYSTNVNVSGLLTATNQQREANGTTDLKLNGQLSSAAQAKANDMIARDYWSHNTPDGQAPWIFFQNAGYKYTKAGENLAYGFATSNDLIAGWMNSPTHKANMLDSAFQEVGFGIANGSNYIGVPEDNTSGPETVVVAMYGQPQVLASSVTAPVTTSKTSTPTPVATSKTSTPTPVATSNSSTEDKSSIKAVVEPTSTKVTKAQTVTKGRSPWIITAISITTGLAVITLLIRHGLGFRRLVKKSESFVQHHPVVDILLVALIMLGYVLSSTTGFVK